MKQATDLASCGLRPVPLGECIPPNPHSVFVSLPTIADIISYEKKEQRVCDKMQGGYPRFVNPIFSQRLEAHLEERENKGKKKTRVIRLISSERMGRELLEYLTPNSEGKIFRKGNMCWISFRNENVLIHEAQKFLQHTGAMVFSREAESFSISESELVGVSNNSSHLLKSPVDIYSQKASDLLRYELEAKSDDLLFLSRCGMSAFFSIYQVVSKIQKKRGRTIWVQMGWLYLDTMEVLQKFAKGKADYVHLTNPLDSSSLEAFLKSNKEHVAGVVIEAPSNPLLQTPDILTISALCKEEGIVFVTDPSMAGIGNINILPHCDVVVTSLTKYTGWSADLILGLSVLNSQSSFYDEISHYLPNYIEAPFEGDVQRFLSLQEEYPSVLQKINENTIGLANYLDKHPRIQNVHWAYSSLSKKNYDVIVKGGEFSNKKPGGVLSFEVDLPLEKFYDRIELPKGPSFGVAFTLLCPFMFLAHYDLVKEKEGRNYLQKNGLNPNLLRLSLGIEPLDDICDAFDRAL